VQSIEQFADVKVTPFCKAMKLKLTKAQIEAHTNPEVLAELRVKKKEKLKRLKLKKLKLKRERIEQQRLHKLQLKLQRQRNEKRRALEAKTIEAATAAAAAASAKSSDPGTPSESSLNGTPRESSLDVADEVILVSNLTLPISDATPPNASASSSSTSPKHKTKSTKSNSGSSSVTSSPRLSAVSAPNKYTYVAPGLQSKYASKKKRGSVGASEDASSAAVCPKASAPAQNQNPNACAFLVGKNVISCCQSFTPSVLSDKATKFGYECRAFVIGLRVLKRKPKGTTEELSQSQSPSAPTFNFSRSVQQFLHNLNHRYTDSHILIELVSVHKMAHYLFPQYANRRPSKETIVAHQKLYAEHSALWKSKSCIATIVDATKDVEPEKGEAEAAEAAVAAAVEAEEEKEEHDSDEALPGMGLETEPTKSTMAESAESDEKAESSRNLKRKEPNESENENENESAEPASKRRKVSVSKVSKVSEVSTVSLSECSAMQQTVIIEHPDTTEAMTESAMAPVANNEYYASIDWTRKVDTSPTFEYALKLYKRSKSETAWSSSAVSHDLTATATHIFHTCADKAWAGKLRKVLRADKYGWNGCKYAQQLDRQRMFDLAHDIAYNYIQHKQEREKRRKRRY